MTINKKEMLLSYIRVNVAPILVDFLFGKDLPYATILPANLDIKELNGHYENTEYLPPRWLNELQQNSNNLLVIDQIDTISKQEQLKFYELLKYRKISTFVLPSECRIIITATEINKDKINEKIYSLVAQI
ncbi:MAG: hypothetical protein Q4C44_03205 [bacterium]|nr:hypothetical protein [bacterium]